MDNLEKIKRLIREGYTNVHTDFANILLSLKKEYPDLKHNEIIDLLKSEFKKFIDKHSEAIELPRVKQGKLRTLSDRIPAREIPYGGHKNKNK